MGGYWLDVQRRPIIDFLVVTESGSIFLNVVNAKSHIKSSYYIVDKLMDCINEVGYQNVVQSLLIMHMRASQQV